MHCWSLRKSFRPLFLLLDACQRANTFRSCFEDIYAPTFTPSIYENNNLATFKGKFYSNDRRFFLSPKFCFTGIY